MHQVDSIPRMDVPEEALAGRVRLGRRPIAPAGDAHAALSSKRVLGIGLALVQRAKHLCRGRAGFVGLSVGGGTSKRRSVIAVQSSSRPCLLGTSHGSASTGAPARHTTTHPHRPLAAYGACRVPWGRASPHILGRAHRLLAFPTLTHLVSGFSKGRRGQLPDRLVVRLAGHGSLRCVWVGWSVSVVVGGWGDAE